MAHVDPPTYDIIILAASGFTGKYIMRETLKFLNTPNSPLKSLALADMSDPASLGSMASQAKLVLNCVGPFFLYGHPFVAACAEVGCGYLDNCGEPDFIKRTEAVYYDKAVENGSLVVLACAFALVPAELGLMFSSRQFGVSGVPNQIEAYLSLASK
ncbi:probable mitochondrial saccharopine dehydrogenase-like oxidoreductase [Tanacetum coccineum]